MEQDIIFRDMIPGSLSNIYEIKILICCMLADVDQPLTRQQINEVFQSHEIVNYFNFCQAVAGLLQTEHVEEQEQKDGAAALSITSLGRETAATLRDSLPKSIVEKSIRYIRDLLKQEHENQDKEIHIQAVEDGYIVRLAIKQEGSDLMDLKLFAPDEQQAKRMAKEFQNKTIDVYRMLIAVLYNDASAVARVAEDIREMGNLFH